MLLGMPCVSADVGGIPSIFSDGVDGIMYEGFRNAGNKFNDISGLRGNESRQLEIISKRLSDAVIRMWSEPEKVVEYCRNAREHAERTHNRQENYARMLEIYSAIVLGK